MGNIKVESVHFTADQKLVEFINERVGKLDTFFDHIVSTDVILKVDKKLETIFNCQLPICI